MSTGIHFVSGKPGGGKSLYSTNVILVALAETRKRVVTNVPLNLPAMRDYLLKTHGQDFDVLSRIRLLTVDETATFWRFYGPGKEDVLLDSNRKERKLASGKVVSNLNYEPRFAAMREAMSRLKEGFKEGHDSEDGWKGWAAIQAYHEPDWDGGILYVIDECHEYFNARAYAEIGIDALHYLSQHRKVGDEVYFVTQHVRNVDTQFRRVAQDFAYIKNLAKTKIPILCGIIKAPALFVRTIYLEEKCGTQDPVEVRTFKLDVAGVASCYDTAAGVGIAGLGADKGSKVKGLPFWVLPVVILALFIVPFVSYYFVKRAALGGRSSMGVTPALASSAPASTRLVPVPVATNAVVTTNVVSAVATNRVRLTGWSLVPILGPKGEMAGKTMWAFLSDGRTLTEGFVFIGRGEIQYKGEKFEL